MIGQNSFLSRDYILFFICACFLFSCQNNKNEKRQSPLHDENQTQNAANQLKPKNFSAYKINRGSFWRALNNDPGIGPELRLEMRKILRKEIDINREKRLSGYPYLSLDDLEKSILGKWEEYLYPRQYNIAMSYYNKLQ